MPEISPEQSPQAHELVYARMMGLSAVTGEVQRVQDILSADEAGQSEVTITEADDQRRGELETTRYHLQGLEREQGAILDTYLDATVPSFFANLKHDAETQVGQPIPWATFLAGQRPATAGSANEEGGETAAELPSLNDQQLTNFLEWRVDYVASIQPDQETREHIDTLRAQYKQAVMDAVRDQKLPAGVADRIDRTDTVQVFAADPLEMALLGSAALRDRVGRYIILGSVDTDASQRPTQAGLRRQADDSLWHEFNHEVLQTTQLGQPIDERWVKEAITEEENQILQVRAMLRHSESLFETSPRTEVMAAITELAASYAGVRDAYRPERQLLNEFAGSMLDLAVAAYAGDDSDRQRFDEAVDVRWGVAGSLERLGAHVNQLTDTFAADTTLTRRQLTEKAVLQAYDDLQHQPEAVFAHMTRAEATAALFKARLGNVMGGGLGKSSRDSFRRWAKLRASGPSAQGGAFKGRGQAGKGVFKPPTDPDTKGS